MVRRDAPAAPAKASAPDSALLPPRALERFGAATADLVMQRELLHRTDSKFLARAATLNDLLEALAPDYALLRAGDAPTATYHTLYFDTEDLRLFHDHRRGRRPRHKVRVRHYQDRGVSFLEVKTKSHAGATRKQRRERPYGRAELGADDNGFIAETTGLSGPRLQPQVWTNFRRITLIGRHSNERITIDTELEIVRGGASERLDGLVIAEVKQLSFCPRTPVMLALRRRGLRPMSGSKYCTATMLLRTDVRANRLLPSLRLIERLSA